MVSYCWNPMPLDSKLQYYSTMQHFWIRASLFFQWCRESSLWHLGGWVVVWFWFFFPGSLKYKYSCINGGGVGVCFWFFKYYKQLALLLSLPVDLPVSGGPALHSRQPVGVDNPVRSFTHWVNPFKLLCCMECPVGWAQPAPTEGCSALLAEPYLE